MVPGDWERVEEIFAAGIAGGEATFETRTPTWEQFDSGKIPAPRLVATNEDGMAIGWAAASRISTRDAYRGVIEHSVYIDPTHQGQGVGRALLAAFVNAAEEAGYWTV
ncbi:hypothetical protein JCM13591A_21110 [Microbacterium xylanilyticum]